MEGTLSKDQLHVALDDGTTWPAPGTPPVNGLEWKLRHCKSASITYSERLYLASIMAAYDALVQKPQRRRSLIASALKRASVSWKNKEALLAALKKE